MNAAARPLSRRRKLGLILHRWHRRLGVTASLFLIWMAVSGWLLNHTGALDLARNKIHTAWILQRYGVATELPERAWIAAQHWLIATPDNLFLDGKTLSIQPLQPLGMVATNSLLFIAGATQLQILNADGASIDTIQSSLLPIAQIVRIGNGCAGVVIADANKIFASVDGANWQPCENEVSWATSAPLTAQQKTSIEEALNPGISVERLLLDLHSGRFLGSWGPYFVDAIGGVLVLLALSGLWMFSQQRRRQRLHRH